MACNRRTERAFPFTWAGMRIVPDDSALSRDGLTREKLLDSIDGYVRSHNKHGFIRVPEPGVYCAKFIDPEPGELEFLFALMRKLEGEEVVKKYAPHSTRTDPEEGTCPLILTS